MKIKKGEIYKIYALCSPDNPEDALYVGATYRHLEVRLNDHIYSKNNSPVSNWCQKLKSEGKKPIIRELEECDSSSAAITESKWTGYFKYVGNLNKKHHKFLEQFNENGYWLKKRLVKWRGKLTQKEAANILGVSVSTYCNWEYGVNIPSILAMKEIDRIINQTQPTPTAKKSS